MLFDLACRGGGIGEVCLLQETDSAEETAFYPEETTDSGFTSCPQTIASWGKSQSLNMRFRRRVAHDSAYVDVHLGVSSCIQQLTVIFCLTETICNEACESIGFWQAS